MMRLLIDSLIQRFFPDIKFWVDPDWFDGATIYVSATVVDVSRPLL